MTMESTKNAESAIRPDQFVFALESSGGFDHGPLNLGLKPPTSWITRSVSRVERGMGSELAVSGFGAIFIHVAPAILTAFYDVDVKLGDVLAFEASPHLPKITLVAVESKYENTVKLVEERVLATCGRPGCDCIVGAEDLTGVLN